MVESSRVEVSCVVVVESSDGGVESSRSELRCNRRVYGSYGYVGSVEKSRGELRCNGTVQYSCDGGGGGVEVS